MKFLKFEKDFLYVQGQAIFFMTTKVFLMISN